MTPLRFIRVFCAFLFFVSFAMSAAQVPQEINYQGRLTDSEGKPAPDGPYLIKFKFYGSESGDDSLWSSGFQTVQVTDGLFNYALGANIPLPGDFFGPGSEPFLGITVGTDPEISPRTGIKSVGFSFQSLRSDSSGLAMDIADNIVSESKIQANAVTGDKILDGSIQLGDIGQNGAVTDQIIKWNGSAWAPAEDISGADAGWTDDGSTVKLSVINDSVGVGTETPAAKLHVYHSETKYDDFVTGIYSNLEVNGTGNEIYGVHSDIISNDDDGLVRGVYSTVDGITSDKTAIYGFSTGGGSLVGVHGSAYNNGTNLSKFGLKGEASGTGTNNYGLFASASGGTNNYAGYFNSGNVVINSGYLGIGTNSPSAKLHIDGTPGVDGIMFPDGTMQTSAATTDVPLILSGSVDTGNKAIIEGINYHTDFDASGVYGASVNFGTHGYLGGIAGVYGIHETSGNFAQLGTSYCAVEGTSIDGQGVLGISTTGAGIQGSSSSGSGVLGSSTTTGVYGRCYSVNPTAAGVKGENITNGIAGYLGTPEYGVAGYGNIGVGVYGESVDNKGVYGISAGVYSHSYGVFGENSSTGNYGILGSISNGVEGYGGGNPGVYGHSNTNSGVYGYSEIGEGVKGFNAPEGNTGSLGTENYGVYGYSIFGDAGYFDGNTTITGNLQNDGSITIGTPSADHQLHVETDQITAGYFTSNNIASDINVVHAEFTGTVGPSAPRTIAVYGKSRPADNYGYGGLFVGGYKGVVGSIENADGSSGTGSPYYAVTGQISGGVGTQYGVYGTVSGSGFNYGIYGTASSGTTNWAGYFSGDCRVTGTFDNSKSTTIIDHPLDPENKYLVHNTISSPDLMNVYNGNVTTDNSGEAEVMLPDYFATLNKDFRYQLTVIGDFAQAIIAEEINNNRFVIRTDKPFIKVSWMVTGVRQDPYAASNPTEIEKQKSAKEAGKYLHPESYGLGEEYGVDYEHHKNALSGRDKTK